MPLSITTALFPHAVLQRTSREFADVVFEGEASLAGRLEGRVTDGRGKALSGLAKVDLGRVKRGAFSARLKKVPVGGPYDIELTLRGEDGAVERARVEDVCVGDVWVLAGQSNMYGRGLAKEAARPVPLVRAFYMDDRWAVAEDPLHNSWDCVDQVHIDIAGGRPAKDLVRGTGPGVAFAQELFRRTGVPQGVIACAHGGTSMAQWDPAGKKLGSRSLYGATLRRVKKLGGKVAGIAWYQGESDAVHNAAAVYTERMKALVKAFRRDLGDPRLPFAMVQICRYAGIPTQGDEWNRVQEQQRRLPEGIERLAVVPSIDLEMSDLVHVSGSAQQRLGKRLAEGMLSLVGTGGVKARPPIAVKGVSTRIDRTQNTLDVVVTFANVEGELRAAGRPAGFFVPAVGGNQSIYNITLEDSRAVLHTTLTPADAAGVQVYYGYGADPYCNITDAGDRSLPVFGPVRLGVPRALTDFVRTVQLSAATAYAGKDLSEIGYPEDFEALKLRARTFGGVFMDVQDRFAPFAPGNALVWVRTAVACPEAMKVESLMGYDGPVKVWVDGKLVLHDPAGTNPATVDKRSVPLSLAAGEHEVLIALASNGGRAWGIHLRYHRLDVPPGQLRRGPGSYALPKIG